MPEASQDNLTVTPDREGADHEGNHTPESAGQGGGGGHRVLARLKKNRALRTAVFLVFAVVVSVGGFLLWRYFQSYESTDDAQIDAHISSVSSRIDGTVVGVYTDDNQRVRAGQLLIDLDPRDYKVAVAAARADVASTRAALAAGRPQTPITSQTTSTSIVTSEQQVSDTLAALASAEHDYTAAVANVRQAEANRVRTDSDLKRYEMLVEKDEVSRQQYDYALAADRAAIAQVEAMSATAQAAQKQIEQRRATLDEARARLAEAQANAPRQVSSSRSQVAALEANVLQAEARLEQALLNLSYCSILAPVSGIIGRREAEVGNRIAPGQELLYITQLDDIWVTANFKETQVKRMRPGERVVVSVDALGGQKFEGSVESMPGATGARFSLLPPENATGNYVKVVQRLPVRIRLRKGQSRQLELRPGMSVEPKVWLQ